MMVLQHIAVNTSDLQRVLDLIAALENVFGLKVHEILYAGWIYTSNGDFIFYNNEVKGIEPDTNSVFAPYIRRGDDIADFGDRVEPRSYKESGTRQPIPPRWTISVEPSEDIEFYVKSLSVDSLI